MKLCICLSIFLLVLTVAQLSEGGRRRGRRRGRGHREGKGSGSDRQMQSDGWQMESIKDMLMGKFQQMVEQMGELGKHNCVCL